MYCSECEDRVSVTGDHLTFDGTTVSATELALRPDGGRSNGAKPSLSSTFNFRWHYPPVSEPHATSWPHTRTADLLHCPDLELRQGLVVHLPVACGDLSPPRRPGEPRETSGPCLTLGLVSSASSTDLCRQRKLRYPDQPRMSSLQRPDFLGPTRALSPAVAGAPPSCASSFRQDGGRSRTVAVPAHVRSPGPGSGSPAVPPAGTASAAAPWPPPPAAAGRRASDCR